MDQSTDVISWLIKQDVNTVKVWLDGVWEGSQDIPKDFYWPHLAAAIEVLARAGKGPSYYSQPDLEWGKLAISIYRYLISQTDPLTRMSLEERMMRLKAHLILYYGNVVGDPILDVNQFVEWFFQNLHQSIDDIEKRSASLEELGTEELLRLSYIKLRLSTIQLLSDRNLLSPDEELSSWLAIQKKLP